jgi:hypothetical protein
MNVEVQAVNQRTGKASGPSSAVGFLVRGEPTRGLANMLLLLLLALLCECAVVCGEASWHYGACLFAPAPFLPSTVRANRQCPLRPVSVLPM